MYFVCYVWQSTDGRLQFMNKVINEHPLDWLARTQGTDPNARCRLVSWQELGDEEAALAKRFKSDP